MLEVKMSLGAEAPGKINFHIVNGGTTPVQFLRYGTIADDFPSDLFSFSQGGFPVKINYIGPVAKRKLDEKAMVTLEAGGSVKAEFDLLANYRFECDAEFEVALKETGLSGHRFACNKLSLRLAADAVKQQQAQIFLKLDGVTLDECSGEGDVSESATSTTRCPPSFVGCLPPTKGNSTNGFCQGDFWTTYPPFHTSLNDLQVATIKNFYRRLVTTRHIVSNNTAYRKWFGAYSYENFNIVRSMISSMDGGRWCKNFTIYNLSTSCVSNTLAYYRPSFDPSRYRDIINLCPNFWRLPDTGIDSKIGTLAHEISHLNGTKDHAYDYNACLALAKTAPEKAINNANNYEYYIEEFVIV